MNAPPVSDFLNPGVLGGTMQRLAGIAVMPAVACDLWACGRR